MTTDRNDRLNALTLSVGRAIAVARRSRGLLQREVALQLDVEQETISRFERGATLQPLDRIMDLAVMLDVPIGAFFVGAPGPAEPKFDELVNLLSLLSERERNLVVAQAISLTQAIAGLKGNDSSMKEEMT